MGEARERRRLIALYDETSNPNFLRAAKCLDRGGDGPDKADKLMAPDQKTRGQPEIDDRDLLLNMAIIMERDGLKQWPAALKVASEDPGHSETSTAKRLDKKFREDRDGYISFVLEIGAQAIGDAKKRRQEFDLALRPIKERQRELDDIKSFRLVLDRIARSVKRFRSIPNK